MVGFGFRLRAFRICWLGLLLGLWEPWGLLLVLASLSLRFCTEFFS
jgi:hypothetical protein